MRRDRACGAVIRDVHILMVQHRDPERTYWTLPGGAIESGETPDDAAVREAVEETGLRTRTVRLLFETKYDQSESGSACYCFLLSEVTDAHSDGSVVSEAVLGHDPEESHVPPADRLLQNIGWKRIDEIRHDLQVSQVIRALSE